MDRSVLRGLTRCRTEHQPTFPGTRATTTRTRDGWLQHWFWCWRGGQPASSRGECRPGFFPSPPPTRLRLRACWTNHHPEPPARQRRPRPRLQRRSLPMKSRRRPPHLRLSPRLHPHLHLPQHPHLRPRWSSLSGTVRKRTPPPRPVAMPPRPIPNRRRHRIRLRPARPMSRHRKKPGNRGVVLCLSTLNGLGPGRSPHHARPKGSESVRACTTDAASRSARAAIRRSGAATAPISPTAAVRANSARIFGDGGRNTSRPLVLVLTLSKGGLLASAWFDKCAAHRHRGRVYEDIVDTF